MKILILNENQSNTIGGIEVYSTKLINIFLNLGHDVTEFSFDINPERKELFKRNEKLKTIGNKTKNKKLLMFEKRMQIKKAKEKLLKIEKDFDLVINNTSNIAWPEEIYNSNRWLYVQHYSKDFYMQKTIGGKVFWPLIYYGMSVFGIKNPFKHFQNFVFYSDADKNNLLFDINRASKISFIVPLAGSSRKEIEKLMKEEPIKSENFVYFGRLDNFQKRIKYMTRIFTNENINLDVYGSGKNKLKKNSKYVTFKDMFPHNDLFKILSKYKFSCLFSKFEGFSFSVVESLSNGIPVVSFRNCASIDWLLKDRGFVVDNKNIKNVLKTCNEMIEDDYKKLRQNCFEFALENLTLEEFTKNWIKILEHFKKQTTN